MTGRQKRKRSIFLSNQEQEQLFQLADSLEKVEDDTDMTEDDKSQAKAWRRTLYKILLG
jgi:hypothetical protein